MSFERYRQILSPTAAQSPGSCEGLDTPHEYRAFLEAMQRPLPRVVWANPIGRSSEALAAIGAEVLRLCPAAVPVGWRPHTWRLPPEVKPGRWWAWMVGDVHGHEEASILAADLVGAQPGERILDLCAAPGGKTAVLAAAMNDQGLLVANDRKAGRLAPLRRTLDRLGVTCAAVSCVAGANFPGIAEGPGGGRPPEPGETRAGGYDRVLVDVPCTCEGNRPQCGPSEAASTEAYRRTIGPIQRSLLRRALQLVRPGGRVVYATCTFAPEENEEVVNAASGFVVEPVSVPGLHLSPGLTEWAGRRLRPDLVNAVRLWPHHNDTGGFFVAVLRRDGAHP